LFKLLLQPIAGCSNYPRGGQIGHFNVRCSQKFESGVDRLSVLRALAKSRQLLERPSPSEWNDKLPSMLALQLMTVLVANHLWSVQMTKRKATTAKKPAGPPIASKAQRATPVIIRSPKPSRLRVAADPSKSSFEGHNDPKETPVFESPATALQDSLKQSMREPELKKGFDFSSATATPRAYQAKLLEMVQANMQFALEFAQRLASIRSPVDFLSVTAEFTSRRSAMFRKHSKEMAELSIRW
jgi:hypothetical protein